MKQQYKELMEYLTQVEVSGGMHTAPGARLLMMAIIALKKPQNIIETGYDAGYTTRALVVASQNHGKVRAIDNLSEYGSVNHIAQRFMESFSNCELLNDEALHFLKVERDNSVDFIFVDDSHKLTHVEKEIQELIRILKPGGIAIFHDAVAFNGEIWKMIQRDMVDWEKIRLPAVSPSDNKDYGIAVVKKPE